MIRVTLLAVLAFTSCAGPTPFAPSERIRWAEPDPEACARAREAFLEVAKLFNPQRGSVEDDLAKYPLCQLSDLTIAQHFPQLSGLRRIRDCPHFTIPPSSTIEFPPTVIGAHQVLTNTVDCGDDVEQRRSDCELRSMPAVFVEDPHLYFFLGDSLSPSEGIRIAKLFYRYSSQLVGEINTADGERLLRINREGANYSLHIEGCGCAGSIVVAIEDEPGDALLVPVSKYQGVCI